MNCKYITRKFVVTVTDISDWDATPAQIEKAGREKAMRAMSTRLEWPFCPYTGDTVPLVYDIKLQRPGGWKCDVYLECTHCKAISDAELARDKALEYGEPSYQEYDSDVEG